MNPWLLIPLTAIAIWAVLHFIAMTCAAFEQWKAAACREDMFPTEERE